MQIVEALFLFSFATSVTNYPGPDDIAYLPPPHDYSEYQIPDAGHFDGQGRAEIVNEVLLSLLDHNLKGTPVPPNTLSLLEAKDVDSDPAVLEWGRVSLPCAALSVRRASVDISPKCFSDSLFLFALRMAEYLKHLVLYLFGIFVA